MESEEGDQSRRETNGSVVVESSAHFNFNNTDAVAVGVANRHELGLGTGVWLDDLATPLRSEFNQYKPPTDVNQMGQFQSFFQNQEKLLPADKSAYLFMVASLGVVPFCDDKSEPYATYIKQWKKKGRKNHLNFTKNMVAQEILRRDPEAKINRVAVLEPWIRPRQVPPTCLASTSSSSTASLINGSMTLAIARLIKRELYVVSSIANK